MRCNPRHISIQSVLLESPVIHKFLSAFRVIQEEVDEIEQIDDCTFEQIWGPDWREAPGISKVETWWINNMNARINRK